MGFRHFKAKCLSPLLLLLLVPVREINAEAAVEQIRDPRYGVALYEYYQDNFYQALTELAVAQAQGGIRGHGRYPQLLQGGIQLTYGMDRQAESMLQGLLHEEVEPAVKDQIWFYTGKMYYQRGALVEAANALNKVRGNLPEKYRNEYHYLNLMLPSNWHDYAMKMHLEAMDDEGLWRAYGLYNAAMVSFKKKQYADVIRRLDQAEKLLDETPESLQLHDRIHVARAYTFLADNRQNDAVHAFERVTTRTPWSQHALLGMGWSALKNEAPEMALGAWKKLAEEPVAGAAVQEALLGVPYVYDKLGSKSQALAAFKNAEQRFVRELDRIETIKSGLTAEVLYQQMVVQPMEQPDGWQYRDKDVEVNPVTPYLVNLVAKPQFQSFLKDIRDLASLEQSNAQARRRVEQLQDVVVARELAQKKLIENAKSKGLETHYQTLLGQQKMQLAAFDGQLQSGDSVQYANAKEQAYLQRINKAEATLAALNDPDLSAEYKDKLQRLRGVLVWDMDQAYPARRWQLEKDRKQLAGIQVEMTGRFERVSDLLANQQQPHRYDDRIRQLAEGVSSLDQHIAQLRHGITLQLENHVHQELDEQKRRINYYLSQSRMNIARLMDEALQEQGVLP